MNYVGALLLAAILAFTIIQPAIEEVANTMNSVSAELNRH